jgi:hypothetical protein
MAIEGSHHLIDFGCGDDRSKTHVPKVEYGVHEQSYKPD